MAALTEDVLEASSMVEAKETYPSLRKNGKNWHSRRNAFRPGRALVSFEERMAKKQSLDATKAREAEMKTEKAQAKEDMVNKIKERRAKKEERQRWEEVQEKVHKKRVDRMKRREKRNKLLNS